VAIGAGKIRILGIDVHEVVAFCIHLLELIAIALRKNEVTGTAIARLDRKLSNRGGAITMKGANSAEVSGKGKAG
jgi:hypothetical protein